jgi:hypothetical protein
MGTSMFAASDFWNRKEPATWSSDEVLELATRSPWATRGRVLPKPGRDRGSSQPLAPEVGGGRSGGRGTGPDPVVAVQEVTVIWESAQPLLDALKTSFPSDFANHYVIGIPDLPPPRTNMTANLARGSDSVDAGAIETTRSHAVIFGFSKELLPFRATDKEVIFSMATDRYSVRARFNLKEMRYHGMLAV